MATIARICVLLTRSDTATPILLTSVLISDQMIAIVAGFATPRNELCSWSDERTCANFVFLNFAFHARKFMFSLCSVEFSFFLFFLTFCYNYLYRCARASSLTSKRNLFSDCREIIRTYVVSKRKRANPTVALKSRKMETASHALCRMR